MCPPRTVTTDALTPEQSRYLDALYHDVMRRIKAMLRAVPSEQRDDAIGVAVLEFCRRMTGLTPEPVTDTLPEAVVGHLYRAVQTARRSHLVTVAGDRDVLTVAIDIASYRQAIAAEPYLASTVTE